MNITAADIRKFKELFVEHFGIELTDAMARVKLMMLVRQMEIVYRPITADQVKQFKNINEQGNLNGKLPSANRQSSRG